MRLTKRGVVHFVQKYMANPVAKALVSWGLLPTHAILETTGRRSGLPRTNPVGNGLRDGTFWLVSEHGRKSSYVRNIEANPRVRVKARGRWYCGTARLLPDDDPLERIKKIGNKANGPTVRLLGTDLLTVRIDLDS